MKNKNELENWKEEHYDTFITVGAKDHLSITMDRCCIAGAKDTIIAYEALDLPIKFAEFIRKYVRSSTTNEYMWNYKGVLYTDEQLYQYWINNIYKSK